MKTLKSFASLLMFSAVFLSSCKGDLTPSSSSSSVFAIVPQPISSDMPETKGFTFDGSTSVHFNWVEKIDAMSVFSTASGESMSYAVKEVDSSNPLQAKFLVENFTLKPGATYTAFYPNGSSFDPEAVPVDYSTQRQYANSDISNLYRASYMTTSPVEATEGGAHFDFVHKNSWIGIKLLFAHDVHILKVVLSSSTDGAFLLRGTANALTGDITPVKTSNKLTLYVGEDEDGIDIKAGASSFFFLSVYNLKPVSDLSVDVYGEEGKLLSTSRTYASPVSLSAGKYYRYEATEEGAVEKPIKIGNEYYDTLAEAIAAVPTDGTATTIKINENIDLESELSIASTKNVILDLNGKTIQNAAGKSLSQLITVNGKLTIDDSSAAKDGVIKNTASAKYVIKTGTAASVLTLNNGTIETTTGNSNGAVYGTNGSFVMTGGTINAAGTGITSKNVTISGGTINATSGQALCAAGTITGGTFKSSANNAVYANQSSSLMITGGTFEGVNSKPTINIYTTDVKISGATLSNGIGFTSNATAMILPGSDDECLASTNAEIYKDNDLIGYASLNTNILSNSKVAGTTVKLTKDIATTAYLNITKSLTLDLNGHNISCSPSKMDAAISAKGTASAPVVLTIKGNGSVSCGDHGEGCNAIQVSNYATVNIESGEFSVPGDNAAVYIIATAGTSVVNISGGTYSSGDGHYVLNIKDGCRDHSKYNVTGGTFVGFNPADNAAEGAGTNFCAEGYTAVKDGNNWVVVKMPEGSSNGSTIGLGEWK